MPMEIHVLAWDRHNNVGVLNQIMGSHPSLYWIIGFPATIQILKKEKEKKNLHKFASIQKNHTKMNDNINMDSTIVGSVNVRS